MNNRSHTSCLPAWRGFGKFTPIALAVVMSILWTTRSEADVNTGQWDEVVGKDVRNNNGKRIGVVRDSLIDLENGRYVGMLVRFGGFLGIGSQSRVIPPAALRDDGTPRTLFLDTDQATLRGAPVFDLPKVGPPNLAKVAAVYRYFGQTPYFACPGNEKSPERLGHLRKGSSILLMPVENLQGVKLGYVCGLRSLNRITGRLKGVVIQPFEFSSGISQKIVQPQALRYSLDRNALRLNNHDQPFEDAPEFTIFPSGKFSEEAPGRPGLPPPPLVHGAGKADKAITREIMKQIADESGLSNYGENIEVATLHGRTTVRGRATSNANRDRLVAIATGVAGSGNVVALIQVRPMTETEKRIDR